MSLTESPVFSRAYGIATAGPIPMTSGGTPAAAKLRILPLTGSPIFLAYDLLAKKTTAAPSVT
jgi:hypothetical protein